SAFDLKQVIEDAVAATSQLFREKNVRLEVLLPRVSSQVVADRDRLMQVLLNLLSNAVKFCDTKNGRVDVNLDVAGERLQVTVSDNGPGVPAQDRERIFEKFRQGSGVLTGKPQGTGLGLPISREIISHFGGVLSLDSRHGEGASFVFTLPAATEREEA
ncbi:MAG: histidine kinase, partial [Burkholderia sp.]|nr:histidine kinase [Burkholderia sp.]